MTCVTCTHPISDAPPLRQDYRSTQAYRLARQEWRRTRGPGCRCKRCPFCWDLLDAQGRCVFPACARLRKKTA